MGRAFLRHWIGIVLTLVSLIQALAFSELVTALPLAWSDLTTKGIASAFAHFILAFALILRVFQTYILAALDYEEWGASFFDLVVIFLVGALEYLLFSTLKASPFSPHLFHARFAPIALLGSIGYVAALTRYRHIANPDSLAVRSEIRLQAANLLGSVVVLGISTAVWLLRPAGNPIPTAAAILCALLLMWNCSHSLRVTFQGKRELKAKNPQPPIQTVEQDCGLPREAVGIAEEKDAAEIARLLFEYFDYIFVRVLDTSPRLVQRLLSVATTAGGGYGSVGYRRFLVVRRTDQTGTPMGVCQLLRRSQRLWIRRAWSDFLFIWAIFRTLGLVGLLRGLENLLQSPVERATRGQDVISYLAVAEDAHRTGVGTSLLHEVARLSVSDGIPSIMAHVRELNSPAISFFAARGFSSERRVHGPLDDDLKLGPQVEMVAQSAQLLELISRSEV